MINELHWRVLWEHKINTNTLNSIHENSKIGSNPNYSVRIHEHEVIDITDLRKHTIQNERSDKTAPLQTSSTRR